jgi:predicted  nucleic acid-binding Zn-ribbon protein
MRLQSKRAQAEQAAAMTILRERIAELQDDLRQVTDGNARLAQHAGAADAALTVEAASLRNTNAAHLDRRRRLEKQVDALRRDRDRLLARIEELMYSPAERQLIDACAVSKETAST